MKQLDTPSFDDLFEPTIKALKVLKDLKLGVETKTIEVVAIDKDLKLGVETKTIEVVAIDHDWFNHL